MGKFSISQLRADTLRVVLRSPGSITLAETYTYASLGASDLERINTQALALQDCQARLNNLDAAAG